jgi:hypothetical protein
MSLGDQNFTSTNVELNVRNELGKSPRELQNDLIDRVGHFDGQTGLYTGKVVNNNDNDREGKCQIRVYGVFGVDVPDSDLPWALPDFNFIGSKVGSFIVPPIGALVKVYFDRGDIYLPHYTTKAVDLRNLPSQKDVDYPNNMVFFETDDGDYLSVNRKSKITTFNHNSGTKVVIDNNGDVTITSVNDLKIKSEGQMILNHIGSFSLQGIAATVNPAPTGGPLCALPVCLFTGAPHTGNTCETGPSVPLGFGVDGTQNFQEFE